MRERLTSARCCGSFDDDDDEVLVLCKDYLQEIYSSSNMACNLICLINFIRLVVVFRWFTWCKRTKKPVRIEQ